MSPLEGISILDLSHVAPGSFCTMILADLGGEVTRIESPVQGRSLGIRRSASPEDGKGKIREALYDPLRRNKRSIAINLKSDVGREIFYRIAKRSDVIVEGFRPGVVERLKIDYKTISKINQRIIYCSLSGYGQEGPYRDLSGHDITYLSMSGVLSLIGSGKGPPIVPLNIVADIAGASQYAALGIMAALIARGKTEKGQYMDQSFTDGALSLIPAFTQSYFLNGVVPGRGESALQGAYPYYGVYETKDGKFISIACIESFFWENLCRALDKEEYAVHCFSPEHYFHKPKDNKWKEIRSWLTSVFLTKTRDEWFDYLPKKDIPIGKVYTLEEALCDKQLVEREMVVEIDHPDEGKVKQVGCPIKLSETPATVRSLSPFFGQHTNEILLKNGFSQDRINEFYADDIVA